MKQALAGFAAGALLALAVMAALRSRATEAVPEGGDAAAAPQAGGTSPGGAPPSAESPKVAGARALLQSLRAEAESLRAARGGAAGPSGPGLAEARSEILRLLLANLDRYIMRSSTSVPVNEEMVLLLQTLIRRTAAELGIGTDEVPASPEGFAAMVRGLLDGLQPPLDREAREILESALAAHAASWKAFAESREAMTRLERGVETERIHEALQERLERSLEGRPLEAVGALDTLWDYAQPTWSGSISRGRFQSTDQAVEKWTAGLGDEFGLDPAQRIALRPLVEDYVRRIAERSAGMKPEETGNGPEVLGHMIAFQKRMLATLNLTPGQAERLREMTFALDFRIVK